MDDKGKRYRTFHVNMLKKWHDSSTCVLFATDEEVETSRWDNNPEKMGPMISGQLSLSQQQVLESVVLEFADIFNDKPGSTTLTGHRIETGLARPIRQRPYRLPHAYRDTVMKDLREMEEAGIIKQSTSEWALPII